jgi:hypothetical protein
VTAPSLEAAQGLVLNEISAAAEAGEGLTLSAPAVAALDALLAGLDVLTVSYVLQACEAGELQAERDDLARRLAESDQHRRDLQIKLHTAQKGTT